MSSPFATVMLIHPEMEIIAVTTKFHASSGLLASLVARQWCLIFERPRKTLVLFRCAAGKTMEMHDQVRSETMNALIQFLAKSGTLTKDFDHHLLRALMVLIFLAFWFAYEAQVLIRISAMAR